MAGNRFSASAGTHDGAPALVMTGELDKEADAEVEAAYALATAGTPARLVLDFSAVSYINSTGIALVVGMLAKARKSSCEIVAIGLSEHYRQIFTITRLSDFMTIVDPAVA
ncbi:MAG: STAS domain-containing protein [Tepidiformaceae bacterium]